MRCGIDLDEGRLNLYTGVGRRVRVVRITTAQAFSGQAKHQPFRGAHTLYGIGRPVALIVAALSLAGCEDLGPILCGAESAPYIVVEVRDARTGQPAARGASGLAVDGGFSDNLRAINELELHPSVYDRAGTYDVVVTKAGYSSWRTRSVQVRDGSCSVRTVRLQAALQPLSARSSAGAEPEPAR
jgi:hypothetical protein